MERKLTRTLPIRALGALALATDPGCTPPERAAHGDGRRIAVPSGHAAALHRGKPAQKTGRLLSAIVVLVAVCWGVVYAGTVYQMRVPILGVPSGALTEAAALCAKLATRSYYQNVNSGNFIESITYSAQTQTPQYQGAPQTVSPPPGAICVEAVLSGAAGSGTYSPGNRVDGFFPLPATLEILVGKGGQHGGSGGLTGVFSGIPSTATAILVAGGGSSPNYGTSCLGAPVGPPAGNGYGGVYANSGCEGTPFGLGSHSLLSGCIGFSGSGETGGYGGGSTGICPGGSGMPGAPAGGGSGGADYAAPEVFGYADYPGGGANGNSGGIGQNGGGTLYFYRKIP